MILANGCNITKSEKFKGVWILSVPTVYKPSITIFKIQVILFIYNIILYNKVVTFVYKL